jgi:hypothetical protein
MSDSSLNEVNQLKPLTPEELATESATALPDKEVISLLDLNADLDLAIDAAAPIDLAVAANANVAAPIDAAVGANVLSTGSSAQALSDQGVLIDQGITGAATANAPQDSVIDQGNDVVDGGGADVPPGVAEGAGSAAGTSSLPGAGAAGSVGAIPTDAAAGLDGDLLNIDVNLAADADIAAPIAGAVAANANVAAPIDAAVAANVGSVDSDAVAIAQQDAIITQDIDATAEATADQSSRIQQ